MNWNNAKWDSSPESSLPLRLNNSSRNDTERCILVYKIVVRCRVILLYRPQLSVDMRMVTVDSSYQYASHVRLPPLFRHGYFSSLGTEM